MPEEAATIGHRLSVIEGHVRSLRRMVEDARPPTDLLLQVVAIHSAMKRVEGQVLEELVQEILSTPEDESREEGMEEIQTAIRRLCR